MIRHTDLRENLAGYAANIVSMFQSATPTELEYGREWYREANDVLQQIADKYGLPIHAVAGAASALSPNVRWGRTIENTIILIEQGEDGVVTAYGHNKAKALLMLNGADPAPLFTPDTKTHAFYFNLLRPTTSDLVTIDSHAVRVALGENIPADDTPAYYRTSPKYRVMSDAYKRAAEMIQVLTGEVLLPLQVQAVAWVTGRRTLLPDRYYVQDHLLDMAQYVPA